MYCWSVIGQLVPERRDVVPSLPRYADPNEPLARLIPNRLKREKHIPIVRIDDHIIDTAAFANDEVGDVADVAPPSTTSLHQDAC